MFWILALNIHTYTPAKTEFAKPIYKVDFRGRGVMIVPSRPCYCQNPNSTTQPNITLVGLDTKMTFHTTPPHPPQKLNVSNISAVTDLILMKL